MSINITHWMQAIGTLNMYTPFGNAYDKEQDDAGLKYDEFFENRKGMSIDLGVRIEF